MKLGVGKIEITPECKVRLCGYATRTEAFAGVKEDIYIRVQIHEDKGNRIVFIYADLLWWGSDFVFEMKKQIKEIFGFSTYEVFMVASHNHSGPPTSNRFTATLETFEPKYCEFLKVQVLECIREAMGNMEEVHPRLYKGTSELNVFRRVIEDGKVKMAPNYEVEADRVLTIVGFYRPDKTLKATLIHYPCHANLSDENFIQPDYPGIALRLLDEKFEGSNSLFLQGCTADLRPNSVLGKKFIPCNYDRVKDFAVSFYEDCCKILDDEGVEIDVNLDSKVKEVPLYMENLKDISIIEEMKDSNDKVEREWAEKVLEVENRDFEVLEIGMIDYAKEISFLTYNCELSQYYALFAKELDASAISVSYTNGMIGYVCTKQQILEGGYEPEGSALYFALSGTYKPNIEEIIRKAIKELVEER